MREQLTHTLLSNRKQLIFSHLTNLGDTGLLIISSNDHGTELFTTDLRYSGANLGYQTGAILGGAFAPTIATMLWTDFDIFWVSVYIAFASFLTLISVMALTETYDKDLN